MIWIVLTIVLIFLSWKYFNQKSTVKKIPGLKKRDEVMGNLKDIAEAGNMQTFLQTLHQNYGPMASFWYGDTFTVSVSSARYFKITEKMFDRHPSLFKFAEPLISPRSMQFLNGEFGRSRYKMLSEPFSFKGCSDVFDDVVEIVRDEVNTWKNGDKVALHDTMMKIAINIVTRTHFGCHFKNKKTADVLNKYYALVIDALDDVVNGLWSFGSGDEREKEYEDNLAIFKDSMRQIVVEHRKQKSSGDYQKAPFLDMLIDNIDDEDEIVHQAITFIIGGFHTTGNYLTWFFYNLGCFQDIQTRVIDEVASKDVTNINDLGSLKMTKQVMNETLRHEKIATFSERQAEHDVEVDGFIIPKGTQILNAHCVSLDNEDDFPNPGEFNPDNFSDQRKHGLEFSPFGYGVRKCPGYRFADMEVCIAAVEVLKKFRIKVAEEDFNIGSKFGFVTKPEREIFVTLQ